MNLKKALIFCAFCLTVSGIWVPLQAHAKAELSFGLGIPFYSGTPGDQLVPDYGLQLLFAATPSSKVVSLVHKFSLGFYFGENFGNSLGSYMGISGEYQPGVKINFSRAGLIPYVDIGPTLGVFAARLGGASDTVSTNQASIKYGYWVGTGFDWLKGGAKRGSGGGWGVGLQYFKYLPSPSSFEFSGKALSIQGVKFEVRMVFGG